MQKHQKQNTRINSETTCKATNTYSNVKLNMQNLLSNNKEHKQIYKDKLNPKLKNSKRVTEIGWENAFLGEFPVPIIAEQKINKTCLKFANKNIVMIP